MASIEKVIDLMVANGESEETILEVINIQRKKYNTSN